ncbi:MAG TPA: LuxR C-terminal-related transcriptional regulator [Solirubrobacteraceae bacterium]|nr:LuxR C-terminal-related transcriptional regulator [Solirubrobacteraceae bacterium]
MRRLTAAHREDYVGATDLPAGSAERVSAAGGGIHTIPAELTSFIGRRRELAQVKAALATARLITLTGPGGVGKTRLARRSAAALGGTFDERVWLVELGEVEDDTLLAQSVAGALDLRDESGRWPVAMLTDHLASRRLLLVLDNCEHLLEASAVLCDALLRACPQLRILATSRQPLGVEGETTLLVPPLSVPESDPKLRPPSPGWGDATDLFAERAAATLPGFTVTAQNAAAVAELCRRLDGMPLAIELAAARLRALTLEQILDRLDDRLRLLTGGGRAGLPRQRTLRATVEWSHDLLAEQERVLWRRLAVFPASFTLDAAETVCAGANLPAGEVLAGVADLTEKSMVARDGSRHRLLETLRAYARERLRDAGEERELSRAHRDWCGELAARARPEWTGPDQVRWFDRLAAEHPSVRAAIEFSLSEPGETERGLMLACDLWLYWQARGHLGEGRRWLSALLERAPQATQARARGLWVAGFLALTQRDAEAAEALLAEGLALAQRLGSERDVAFANQYLGLAALFREDTAAAAELLRDAVDVHRRVDEPAGAFALADLAIVTMLRGQGARAEALFEDSIAWAAASGDRWTRSHALWGLGVLALDDGRADLARDLQSEALSLMRALDERTGIALCVEALAWVAGACGQAERAARLIGATHAVWESIPSSLPGVLSARHEACERRARSRLGTPAYERAVRAGATLSREAAVADALGETASAAPSPPLTPREREVANLVAAGLTDREIATRLVISVRTAEAHVAHILAKLGLRTRTEVAAMWAVGEVPASPRSGR